MSKTIYMSFVDPKKPAGQRFLGACLVHAESFEEAIKEAWRRGCNPGGEVMGLEPEFLPSEKWYNRLLSKEQLDEMEAEVYKARGMLQ